MTFQRGDDALYDLLMKLIEQWESFAHKHGTTPSLSDYESGFITGFEAAAAEMRILLAQLEGVPADNDELKRMTDELEIQITPDDEPPNPNSISDWEYLYIRFEQTAQGYWHIRELSGAWHTPWQSVTSLEDAITHLRDKEGWRLSSFANGIHVFRRPV